MYGDRAESSSVPIQVIVGSYRSRYSRGKVRECRSGRDGGTDTEESERKLEQGREV